MGVSLDQILKIDAVAIDALLLATLQHPSFVTPGVEDAQLLLDFLQTVSVWPQISESVS
jgi:hypothetical protein